MRIYGEVIESFSLHSHVKRQKENALMHNNKRITFIDEHRGGNCHIKINTQSQLNSTMQFNIFHIPMLCVIDERGKSKREKCKGVVKKVQATN